MCCVTARCWGVELGEEVVSDSGERNARRCGSCRNVRRREDLGASVQPRAAHATSAPLLCQATISNEAGTMIVQSLIEQNKSLDAVLRRAAGVSVAGVVGVASVTGVTHGVPGANGMIVCLIGSTQHSTESHH